MVAVEMVTSSISFPRDLNPSHTNSLFNQCSNLSHVKQVHAHVHKLGLTLQSTRYSSKLLNLYITLCHEQDKGLNEASMLFSMIEKPDVFMYNAMIREYSNSARSNMALMLYNQMVYDQVQCNSYTLPFVLKSCDCFEEVEQLHSHVLKTGFGSEVHSANALIHAYFKVGDVESGIRIFGSMVKKDIVSGNLMMNGLIKCGRVEEALCVLRSMQEKNVVSWTTLIKGCVDLGLSNEALNLFQEMIDSGVRPDKVALAGAVAACGVSGSLARGEWIHSYIVENRINVDSTLHCVLIDMYAKCGALDKAVEVFHEFDGEKNVAVWTALISGFGAHGHALMATEWFYQMQVEGIRPNAITFTSILTACSHAGLVNEGKNIFMSMEKIYKLQPSIEHYGCMVDLMARAGQLEQAMNFIENIPIKPNAAIWGAMITACCSGKHMELGKMIAKKLIELEPDQAGRYIQLCNLYALDGEWEQASAIRKELKDSSSDQFLKVPGHSLIDLNGSLFKFLAIP